MMIKTPVRGMRDLTPSEMMIRSYILNIIEEESTRSGYQKIETPAVEHIENLTSKNGGENESLIFKILKRGQALIDAKESGDDLVDSGLRYDLTVPLARYFANNQSILMSPFKSLQIGSVWRADRPQKGRFRQFTQCDMDILGDGTVLAEIDAISTVTTILNRIFAEAEISDFTIHLNDRRILAATLAYAGFNESDYESVLIALDKNDKIGLPGVKSELLLLGFDAQIIDKFIELFNQTLSGVSVNSFCASLSEFNLDAAVISDIEKIILIIGDKLGTGGKIVFSPTLVRGMGYYTGPIFECTVGDFNSSVAGGGRYDKMIGQISGGVDVPACGFSIGFERIIALLDDAGFVPATNSEKVAFLVDKKVSAEMLKTILEKAADLRRGGKTVSVLMMNKNLKFQIEMLENNGYSVFEKFFKD